MDVPVELPRPALDAALFIQHPAQHALDGAIAASRWLHTEPTEQPAAVVPGTVLVITEGLRNVAYFHLERVDQLTPGTALESGCCVGDTHSKPSKESR